MFGNQLKKNTKFAVMYTYLLSHLQKLTKTVEHAFRLASLRLL